VATYDEFDVIGITMKEGTFECLAHNEDDLVGDPGTKISI
jgi:hypothetical protein